MLDNKLKQYLDKALQQNASDVHVAAGFKPTIRIDGQLVPLAEEPIISPEKSEEMVLSIFTP